MNWLKNRTKIFAIAFTAVLMSAAGYAVDQTFNVTINILASITVTPGLDLIFPDTESTQLAQRVVVAPGGTGAATFTISGEPGETLAVSVVEPSITMTDGTNTFFVDTFTVGGTSCSGGVGALDGYGNLNSCEVGATANIEANQAPGRYSGTATLQVVYN